jgi:hypothetical protein
MVRHFDAALIVNPGSVGLPFAKREDAHQPWAEYGSPNGLRRPVGGPRRIDFDAESLPSSSGQRNAPRDAGGCGSDRQKRVRSKKFPRDEEGLAVIARSSG